MITLYDLEKYDLSQMYKVYDKWPQIAKKAYNTNFDNISLDGIKHIVFAGMGGSGAIGDVFMHYFHKLEFSLM